MGYFTPFVSDLELNSGINVLNVVGCLYRGSVQKQEPVRSHPSFKVDQPLPTAALLTRDKDQEKLPSHLATMKNGYLEKILGSIAVIGNSS